MGASTSKNDYYRKAPYDYDDSPRKRRKTDCDEADRQLVVSGVKIEAKPVHSSPEVLELRQYLLMAKQAQLNAEQLVINTAQQLLDTEQRAAEKEEMYKSGLRDAVSRAEQAEQELGSARGAEQREKEKVNQLEKEKKQASKKVDQLKKELEEEKKKGSEKEKSIEKLKRKLVECGVSEQEANAVVRIDHSMDAIADNTNILSLLRPNANHAISLDEAVKWVRASFEKCGEITKQRFATKPATFDCRVCGLEMRNKLTVTTHFLSEEHIGKVRASGASVSKIAIRNWANSLDHLPKRMVDGKRWWPYINETV